MRTMTNTICCGTVIIDIKYFDANRKPSEGFDNACMYTADKDTTK